MRRRAEKVWVVNRKKFTVQKLKVLNKKMHSVKISREIHILISEIAARNEGYKHSIEIIHAGSLRHFKIAFDKFTTPIFRQIHPGEVVIIFGKIIKGSKFMEF